MAKFQDIANDLKSGIEECLNKFKELEHGGMTSELSVVKTKLQEANARIEQELAKYASPQTTQPMSQQRPIIVAKQADVPLEQPLSPQDTSPSDPASVALNSEVEPPQSEKAVGNEPPTA